MDASQDGGASPRSGWSGASKLAIRVARLRVDVRFRHLEPQEIYPVTQLPEPSSAERLYRLKIMLEKLESNKNASLRAADLRSIFTGSKIKQIRERCHALRIERNVLRNTYPTLNGEADEYWENAKLAITLRSLARGKRSRNLAATAEENALELWESVPISDHWRFRARSDDDVRTGKFGIDEQELLLPILLSEACHRQEFDNIEWHVQREAIQDEISALHPKSPETLEAEGLQLAMKLRTLRKR